MAGRERVFWGGGGTFSKENIKQFATIPQISVIFHFIIISLNHFHQNINIVPIQTGKTLKHSSCARNINIAYMQD